MGSRPDNSLFKFFVIASLLIILVSLLMTWLGSMCMNWPFAILGILVLRRITLKH